MQITPRDKLILESVHAYDGVLSDYQVMYLHFNPETGMRQAQHRLSLLWQHGYLARPNRRLRATLSCMVYWLDEKGAAYVASLSGQVLSEFSWRKPGTRWSLIDHDLATNDFRISMVFACQSYDELDLGQWIPSGEFWAYPDSIEYRDHQNKKVSRKVRPDSYFEIADRQKGLRRRYLLELDRRSEDNPRFGREKVLPGLAYLSSDAYERRSGHKSGHILVVTTGERRALNMKMQTERVAGKGAQRFCFTVFDWVNPQTVLTEPIWYQGGEEEPRALLSIS